VVLLAIILIQLLQLLISSASFLQIFKIDLGVPVVLALTTALFHSRVTVLPFLASGSFFVTASTFAHDGHF
jgi:hypothetical protein